MKQELKRRDTDPPASTGKWGWKYHHTGIPTNKKREGERYIPALKMFVSGFSESPYGIEWMRFESNSPVHPLVQKIAHVAFEVENLEEALKDKNIITKPALPSDGVRVAMIEENGAPIELIEFQEKNTI